MLRISLQRFAQYDSADAACSVPSVRIRFALKLVNESRRLTQPLKSLFGSKSIKFSVTIEIIRLALCKCTLEFLAC